MASIMSSLGIGSGLDINTMVTQLVAAEGKPGKDAVAAQQSTANTRLSGLGTLKSVLTSFQTAVRQLNDSSLYQKNLVTSSDETVLKATAGIGSVQGSQSITVTQLAKAQKSIANTEFSGVGAVVGTGTLTFAMDGGSSFSITLDSSNNTLAGLRSAINNSSSNTGISASIISVDSTTNPGTTVSKLVLTGRETGASQGFTVDAGGDADLVRLATSNTANYTKTAASDAILTIDGETATRSSNEITDVLQGVTLNLSKLGTATIDLKPDQDSIKKSVDDFVSAYNSLTNTAKNLGKYGGSGANATGNGLLLGNSTLRIITSQIRQNTTGVVGSANGAYNSLAMIGVTVDKSGVMALDSSVFQKAMAASPTAVSDVFTSSDGVASRLSTKLTDYLSSGGILDSQQTSLNQQLKKLDVRSIAIQSRLDSYQATLIKQFTAMDLAVSKFQSTGAYLTKQFA